jgi:gliding motility-associated-like protein
MDIAVNDFDNIVEMQFSMNWDSTKFIFDHVEGFNLAGLDINAFGPPGNPGVKQGQLLVSWLDLTLNGVSVPDLTPIFRLCLKAIGPIGSSSPVTFSNIPLEIEIATLDSVLQFGLVQGLAQIKQSCDTTCTIGYTIATTPPACIGTSTGAVDLTVTLTNCTGSPTYLWSNTALTQDLTGVPAGTYTVTITLGSSIVIASTTVTDPSPLGVTSTITDPNPPGSSTGIVDITVSGGMPPYAFLWSYQNRTTEDLTGVPSGSYTVTITDSKGCTFIPDPYIVGADLTATVNNPTCAGICNGSVTNLTPSFGTAPYTYLWSNGATTKDINNLCAGTYCVTITDIGGSTRDTCFNIIQPPALVVTATLINDVNENCHGAIDLNVTGGTPAYSYTWSNLATTQDILNLCAGQYCVTITHNLGACSFDTCFNIFAGDFRIDNTIKQYGNFQTSCNGVCDGDINAVVTGGTPPLTYHWSNGFTVPHITNLCAGVYGLTVTDATGKTTVSSTTITSPPALDLNITSTLPTDITASDGAISVVVTGGVPNYIYQWTGPVSWNTASQNNLPSGIYHLLVTDANQCEANEVVELIPEGPGCYEGIPIITPNDDGKNDYFIITCAIGTNNHLSIYNRSGGLVYQTNNYTNNWTGVDGDHQTLPDGGYFWILEVFSQTVPTQVYKGTVNILRTAD